MSAGGSVRRARERMEAGVKPEAPRGPPPPMFDPRRQQAQNPTRPRPQMAPMVSSKESGRSMIGVAISRPTPVPQWPLQGSIEPQDVPRAHQYLPPQGWGPAPQRPPRPSHVPSMLDASQLQQPTPSFNHRPPLNAQDQPQAQWRGFPEDDYYSSSPDMTSPVTPSSRVSTISSVGTIPDFPVPAIPPRRSVHLGPPPSSRRGASSYYSQTSFVSPIPEESPRTATTHRSYASSAAIPSSWGSEYEYDSETPEREFEEEHMHGRGDSRDSTTEDGDEKELIRSASMGKRAKPAMINTKSAEKMDQVRPGPRPQQDENFDRMGPGSGKSLGVPSTDRDSMWPISATASSHVLPMSRNPSRAPGEMGWPISSSLLASSLETVPGVAIAVTTDDTVSPISPSQEYHFKTRDMAGANNLQPPAMAPTSRTPSPTTGGFSRLSAIRRPPRLDIDAVRDAEARGSLTSLPDLIRRATRLAAMIDRGKRPGSRLHDLNDFPMDEKDFERDFAVRSPEDKNKRRSGLSGMLASIPSPGIVGTPRTGTPNETTERRLSVWPQGYQETDGDKSEEKAPRKRRCCGLPCWGLMVVLVIIAIILAAAIVVPVKLLSIDKTPPPQGQNAGDRCQSDPATACQNGGISIIDNGACACVCTNGFTGSTCNIAGASGCTTTTLGSLSNVTLGESIPRLISTAQTNFSVPLVAETLVARFNNANLSCGSGNALVTFDGLSSRGGNANDVVVPIATDTPSATRKVRRGGGPGSTLYLTYSTPTHMPPHTSTPSTPPPTIVVNPWPATTPMPTHSRPPPSTEPSTAFTVTEEVLDFSRVAVLYIMQQKNLDNAVTAQSSIQSFISKTTYTNQAAMNIELGNNNTINLVAFTVNVGNGAVGRNRSTSSTSLTSVQSRRKRDQVGQKVRTG
ncbi:hypothetical protein HYALB_00009079 [Hymenoscyphus albidus]|uniref:EGF-like domain-containing protein n=1 Tax=Hymenoscyphus albidus TaxID=595503 RepID=A0A9N9Q246_9HELO|nr:hypothetical protein HYALB_00009079 [Hymenoscyphus albidus]